MGCTSWLDLVLDTDTVKPTDTRSLWFPSWELNYLVVSLTSLCLSVVPFVIMLSNGFMVSDDIVSVHGLPRSLISPFGEVYLLMFVFGSLLCIGFFPQSPGVWEIVPTDHFGKDTCSQVFLTLYTDKKVYDFKVVRMFICLFVPG